MPLVCALSFSSCFAQHAELVTPYSRFNLWTGEPRSSGASVVRMTALEAPPRCVLWRGFALSAPQSPRNGDHQSLPISTGSSPRRPRESAARQQAGSPFDSGVRLRSAPPINGSPSYCGHRPAPTNKRMPPSTISTRPGQFAFSPNPAPGVRGSRVIGSGFIVVSRGTAEALFRLASLSRPRQIG
jgi:hypothetical protein